MTGKKTIEFVVDGWFHAALKEAAKNDMRTMAAVLKMLFLERYVDLVAKHKALDALDEEFENDSRSAKIGQTRGELEEKYGISAEDIEGDVDEENWDDLD